jgi:hypothetical protein
MKRLKAIVRGGRLLLDAPSDLPEGSVVELAIVQDDAADDPELLEELTASAREEATGALVDLDAVVARLGTRQSRQ